MLFLGAGYTAKTMMKNHPAEVMWGTTRSAENLPAIKAAGATPILFEGHAPSEELRRAIKTADHILISISPDSDGDIILRHHESDIIGNDHLKWIGYLSTVGVYGDHQGAWVDETAETRPCSERSRWRKLAEDQWLTLSERHQLPIHIFRLPGIYGPGRGPQQKLKKGTARRIEKPGQVFNRAHVKDIAAVLHASTKAPSKGQVYNIADDEPAPPQDVIAYAAELMGVAIPPLIPFEEAEMSKMAKSFYSDNKRIDNKRIKSELGVKLHYPTYREGIKAALEEG
jgi:dTDP-D-glucose 4,6-dehydratase